MILFYQMSSHTLARDVRDYDFFDAAIVQRSTLHALECARTDIQRARGYAGEAQHAATHGIPPVALEEARATGAFDNALDRLGCGALRAFATLGSTECSAAVREEDGVEPPRAAVTFAGS